MARKKDMSEHGYEKRLKILIAGVVVCAAAITGGTMWLLKPANDETQISSTVELTEVEKIEAKEISEEFVNAVGNFGIISDQITGDNLLDVKYILADDASSVSDYISTRADSYRYAKDKYVYPHSPIDYDSRTTTQWSNDFETERLSTFEANDVTAEVNPNGKILNLDGRDATAVDVDVTFDSVQTMRDVTANDTTWDGSWAVFESNFYNTKATVTLVRDEDDVWKVYTLKDLDNSFLLSTWLTPSLDVFAEKQINFTQVGTLNRTEPFKEPKQ